MCMLELSFSPTNLLQEGLHLTRIHVNFREKNPKFSIFGQRPINTIVHELSVYLAIYMYYYKYGSII